MGLVSRLAGDDADVLADPRFRVILLGSVVSPMGSSLVSPLLDSLVGVYGVSEARIGLVMAAFTAPAIVAIPLVGLVSDRYGRKPVLTVGLAIFGAAGAALAFTTDFRAVVALRLLQGVGFTGIAPVLIAATGDLFTGDREATAQGLRFTTVGLSLALFPALAGLLVALAWQFPFALFALGIPAALVVHLWFEEPETADADGGLDWHRLAAVLRRPRIALVLLGRPVPSVLWFGFLTYNSIVVVRFLDGTPGAAGALVGVASVASSVGGTQVGRLTAAFETRRVPLLVGTAASGLGLGGIALAPSLAVAGVGAVVIGAGFGIVLTLYRSTISTLAPDGLRGSLVSVGESAGRLGSTLTPIVMGAAVAVATPRYGFEAAVRGTLLAVVGGAVAVGVVAIVLADRRATLAD
ncbi:MFS transporter [Haloplanus aerogenes]|uniref:ACDE family multidrug resistance protein n=1 Tax=Haloplanus aerogenes TaxID=660522 RepID=A0A3M0DQ92_9EURY|nr:MFS transporter [Haloplanus aerogenes]RMB23862.1 ACDE family multidrug resistance protein [Haloplanus aerogenes]